MNTELSNTDKLNLFYEELKKMNFKIFPPCINNSYSDFLPNDKNEIYYALSAIKAVGYDSISKIVLERETNGKYKNLNDFLSRNSSKNLNKLQLEGLIKAGAFDCLEKNRRKIFESVPDLIKASKTSEITSNNLSLFTDEKTSQVINLNDVKQWKESEIIEKEFESIGFFVSDHPLKNHNVLLDDLKVITYKDFKSNSKLKTCVLSGTLMKLQEKKTSKGSPYAIAKFTDLSQMFELFIFSENLIENREYLKIGNSFIINVKKDLAKDGTERINVTRVFFIENLIPKYIKEINVYLDDSKSLENFKNNLKKDTGSTIINLKYKKNNSFYNFRLTKTRNVNYDDIKSLKSKGININIKN